MTAGALAGLFGSGPRLARTCGQDKGLAQRGAIEAFRQQERPNTQARAVIEAIEVDTLVAGRRQRGRPLLKRNVPTGRLTHDGTPAVWRPVTSGLDSNGRVTSPAAAVRDPAYFARIALLDNVSEAIFSWRRMMP